MRSDEPFECASAAALRGRPPMVEQQQFAGKDSIQNQAATVESSGISGQNRMELYQDFSKTVGQTASNEKSSSGQSLTDGKNNGQLEFDNVFDKTGSQGPSGASDSGRDRNDPNQGDLQEPGRTGAADGGIGRGDRNAPNHGDLQEQGRTGGPGTEQHDSTQRSNTQEGGEFSGRKDRYTREALEQQQRDAAPNETIPQHDGSRNGGTDGQRDAAPNETIPQRDGSRNGGTDRPDAAPNETIPQRDGSRNGGTDRQRHDTQNPPVN